ncbi:MAG: hypothetical protein ACMUEL_06190 [Flavobacteriales bacterium Tduv]
MIVDTSITVRPFAPKGDPIYVVEDRKEEGKVNQSKKRKDKKRDSIRIINLRKMA